MRKKKRKQIKKQLNLVHKVFPLKINSLERDLPTHNNNNRSYEHPLLFKKHTKKISLIRLAVGAINSKEPTAAARKTK